MHTYTYMIYVYIQVARVPRIIHKILMRCCAELSCAVLSCAVLCCAALRCAVLCCAALRCAVLCCAVLRCAVLLRCAALYFADIWKHKLLLYEGFSYISLN